MKKDMPLEGLRWSRDSGSALYDTPQTAVLGRAGGGQWMQGKRVATQNIFKLRLLTININYSIIQKILQAELMNLQVLELSLATLGVELHILVWSYREHEVGHGDTAAIYEELN